MVASRPFNFETVKLLVEKGAELNYINIDGKTALTLVRTRPWTMHGSDRENSIWEIFSYLNSKGAKEQDYVDFIAKDISGKYAVLQKKVLEIKKTYADYNKNLRLYKLKKFHEENRTGDYITYTLEKYDYLASYDVSGNLAFFGYTYYIEKEWNDNGTRESGTKHYFFMNKELYFYFEDYAYGFNPSKEQYRVYIDKGKEVITAYKFLDDLYKASPEGMKDIADLVNIKCEMDKKPSVKDLSGNCIYVYDMIKDKLK
jgi:hypothetical protein